MPSTFVHAMLPAACLWVSRPKQPRLNRTQLLKLAVVAVFLANSPDLDVLPASFLFTSHWTDIHRAWGHNIFSLCLWTYLGFQLLTKWVSPYFSKSMAWGMSSVLVLSHIFLDSMSDMTLEGKLPGVPLFYPFTRWEFHLPFRLFKTYPLEEHMNPLLAHITSSIFWHRIFYTEMFASLLLFAIWVTSLFLIKLLRTVSFKREAVLPQPPDVGL